MAHARGTGTAYNGVRHAPPTVARCRDQTVEDQMSEADRPGDGNGLSCPERDAMVATLLGMTPDRLRTIRRVHDKRAGTSKPTDRSGTEARWQRIDQLDDDALFAAFRMHEVRARNVVRTSIASAVDRMPRRSVGRR